MQKDVKNPNKELWITQKYCFMNFSNEQRSSKANSPQNKISNDLFSHNIVKGLNPVWESREVRVDQNYSTLRTAEFNNSNTWMKEWNSDNKDLVLL